MTVLWRIVLGSEVAVSQTLTPLGQWSSEDVESEQPILIPRDKRDQRGIRRERQSKRQRERASGRVEERDD